MFKRDQCFKLKNLFKRIMAELLDDEHIQKSDPYMEEFYGLLDAREV